MDMANVAAIKNVVSKLTIGTHNNSSTGFKAILAQKRAVVDKVNHTVPPQIARVEQRLSLKSMTNSVVRNHEVATQEIKTFMTRSDYSPDRLIAIQYRSGMFFLREQMYCKTAELTANTFKNFTQTQI